MKLLILLALTGSPGLPDTSQDPSVVSVRHNTELGESPTWQVTSAKFDTPPRRLSGKAPVFPVTHLMKGVEGKVIVAYTVGVDGRASDFEILEATDKKFADHVVIALREWRFEPAQKDGVDVAARVKTPFSFGL